MKGEASIIWMQREQDQMTSVGGLFAKRLYSHLSCNRQTKINDVEGQVSMANARRFLLYKQLRVEASSP